MLASRLMQLRHFPHSCTQSIKCLVQKYVIRNTPIVLRVNQSVSWFVATLAGQDGALARAETLCAGGSFPMLRYKAVSVSSHLFLQPRFHKVREISSVFLRKWS